MQWLMVLFGLSLSLKHSNLVAGSPSPVNGLDELLTYECARGIATLVEPAEQQGPVFSQGPLVFTSLGTQKGNFILIVSAGAGTYVVPLDHRGINRIRFELPSSRSSKPQMFYLSYLHDNALRSRVFEFSMLRAPPGRDDLDYRLVEAQRAGYLDSHLEYAIWETSSAVLSSLLDGALKRQQLNPQKADCDHIQNKSPLLGRHIRRNLDELEMMAAGPKPTRRMPASVPTKLRTVH